MSRASRRAAVAGLAAAAALGAAALLQAPSLSATEQTTMSQRILVHITHGPEHPTRAALGFAVAHAALEQGHSVTVFLAGDGVQLLREGVLDALTGLGTGRLRPLHDGIVEKGGQFYVSGGSGRARGLDQGDLEGRGYRLAGPAELVELALDHDRMFTY